LREKKKRENETKNPLGLNAIAEIGLVWAWKCATEDFVTTSRIIKDPWVSELVSVFGASVGVFLGGDLL